MNTGPASGETVNYFDVQRVADELGIDYNKLCAAIRRLAAVAPAGMDGWIPVSQRLPDDNEWVVVFTPDIGNGETLVHFDYRSDGVWSEHFTSYEHFVAVGGVGAAGPDCICTGPSEEAPYTHWQPLPAAPTPPATAGQE